MSQSDVQASADSPKWPVLSQALPVAAGICASHLRQGLCSETLVYMILQELEETGTVPVTEGQEEPEAEDPEEFKRRWDLIIARYEATFQKKKDRKVGFPQAGTC